MGDFEERLYEAMCRAFPKITVRSFSKMLGRSEGYWSSITAQSLPVSNQALSHLHSALEIKVVLSDAHEVKLAMLQSIKDLVVREVMRRIRDQMAELDLPTEGEWSVEPEDLAPLPFFVERY